MVIKVFGHPQTILVNIFLFVLVRAGGACGHQLDNDVRAFALFPDNPTFALTPGDAQGDKKIGAAKVIITHLFGAEVNKHVAGGEIITSGKSQIDLLQKQVHLGHVPPGFHRYAIVVG